MNAIRRLFTPSGAVARWQTHLAEVNERIAAEDRKILEYYQKVIDADSAALADLAATPSLDNVKRSISAGAAKRAAEASRDMYLQCHGNGLTKQIDKALNVGMLEAAIDEARREITKRKAEAVASAQQLAADSATNGADMLRSIEETFGRRLAALDSAEHVLENTRKSSPEKQFSPSGISFAASYLDTALA